MAALSVLPKVGPAHRRTTVVLCSAMHLLGKGRLYKMMLSWLPSVASPSSHLLHRIRYAPSRMPDATASHHACGWATLNAPGYAAAVLCTSSYCHPLSFHVLDDAGSIWCGLSLLSVACLRMFLLDSAFKTCPQVRTMSCAARHTLPHNQCPLVHLPKRGRHQHPCSICPPTNPGLPAPTTLHP